MTPSERIIYLVSADAAVTQPLMSELMAGRSHYQMPIAASVEQACKELGHLTPAVILLDESALQPAPAPERRAGESLESAVATLTGSAPVVVVAAAERQSELAFFISSGAVDFVARVGNFLPVVVGLLERRVRLAEPLEQGQDLVLFPAAATSDFGEILRHEVNNPLTGILGNAELLLAEFKKNNGAPRSEAAVQRLQIIAELAVRLRETVRRLSNAWDSRADHTRSA